MTRGVSAVAVVWLLMALLGASALAIEDAAGSSQLDAPDDALGRRSASERWALAGRMAVATPVRAGGSAGTDGRGADVLPAIAYDATTQRALAVWLSARNAGSSGSALDVYGIFLDASGQPVGSEFAISDSTTAARASGPVVAAGGGEFAVAWTSRLSPCEISVQRVTASGSVSDHRLLAGSSHVHSPRLVYNGSRGKFVLAYVDGDDYLSPTFLGAATSDCGSNPESLSQVRVAEFSFSGDVPSVSSSVAVANTGAGAFRPSIAYSAALDRYLVAWEDRRDAAGAAYRFDVYARQLNADLSAAGSELALATGGSYDSVDSSATWTPRPAVGAGDEGFMVGWFDRTTQDSAVVWSVDARPVTGSGSVGQLFEVARAPFVESHPNQQPTGFLSLGYTSAANEFLVALTTHLESVFGYRSFVLVQRVAATGGLINTDGSAQSGAGVGTSIDYSSEDQITVGVSPASSGASSADYLVSYGKHAVGSGGVDYDVWINRVTIPASVTPTFTPTVTPTITPTFTPTFTSTFTPTVTPTPSTTPRPPDWSQVYLPWSPK